MVGQIRVAAKILLDRFQAAGEAALLLDRLLRFIGLGQALERVAQVKRFVALRFADDLRRAALVESDFGEIAIESSEAESQRMQDEHLLVRDQRPPLPPRPPEHLQLVPVFVERQREHLKTGNEIDSHPFEE